MAKRFGVLEAHEPETAEPRSHVSKNAARYLLRKMLAVPVAGRNRVIQMLKAALAEIREACRTLGFYDGPLGVGNAIPFSKPTDGKPFHYEIGPKSLWAKYGYFRRKNDGHKFIHRRVIKVSARPQSHLAAQLMRRTQPLTLGSPNASPLVPRLA